MKRWWSLLLSLVMFLELSILTSAAETNEVEEIVEKYYQYVNAQNVSDYIQLFTADNRYLMNDYVIGNGTEEFFAEQALEIKQMKMLTEETGYLACFISSEEMKEYGKVTFVYVEQEIQGVGNKEELTYVCFVLVNEGNELKIERVATPCLQYIYENNEQFGNSQEYLAQSEQMSRLVLPISNATVLNEGTMLAASALIAPSTITVYFTKDGNANYHGCSRATLDFNTYLRCTIHEEWVVARYASYPAYLQAGVMASKMYAWYNTVNPKRNYAPYYACVLDNSMDQNYWYNSVNDLNAQGSHYVTYLDNALNYASTLALVTEDSESIFETEYRTAEGNIHSGIMNQEGAWALAQQGYSCLQILQEYYGSAPRIQGDYVKLIAHQ